MYCDMGGVLSDETQIIFLDIFTSSCYNMFFQVLGDEVTI